MIITCGAVPKLPPTAARSDWLCVLAACWVVFCNFDFFCQWWRLLLPCKVGQNLSEELFKRPRLGGREVPCSSPLPSHSFLQRRADIQPL